jgi:hypothetical protein
MLMPRLFTIGLLLVVFSSLIAFQPGPASRALTDPFAAGWMVADSNGDGIVDFVPGKIVLPTHPSAAENAAAADIAAHIGSSVELQRRTALAQRMGAATLDI